MDDVLGQRVASQAFVSVGRKEYCDNYAVTMLAEKVIAETGITRAGTTMVRQALKCGRQRSTRQRNAIQDSAVVPGSLAATRAGALATTLLNAKRGNFSVIKAWLR